MQSGFCFRGRAARAINSRRGTFEKSSRPIFPGTLPFEATPPSLELSILAGIATLLCRWRRSNSPLSPPAKLTYSIHLQTHVASLPRLIHRSGNTRATSPQSFPEGTHKDRAQSGDRWKVEVPGFFATRDGKCAKLIRARLIRLDILYIAQRFA